MLPSVANPQILCGGFRGESKMSYLQQIPPALQRWVAPSYLTVAAPGLARPDGLAALAQEIARSEEHTSELQSLMRISYAVFCLKKKIREGEGGLHTDVGTGEQHGRAHI